ncbi:MAG: hypothetical protein WC374_03590 [Phycisphaerae bacterium]|jgi:hypothetical protein
MKNKLLKAYISEEVKSLNKSWICNCYEICIRGLLALIIITASGCNKKSSVPTDEELIKTFNENKKIFIQLQDNLKEDGYRLVSMNPEWSDPPNIKPNVRKEYYNLFRQVGIKQIGRTDIQSDSVDFIVWRTGNVSGGDIKGYNYTPCSYWLHKEKETLNNISPVEEFFYIRKICDDWCLYYSHSL